MAEEFKDEKVAESHASEAVPASLPNVVLIRKLALGPDVAQPATQPVTQPVTQPLTQPPHPLKFGASTQGRLPPFARLEQDVPWKLVFVVYVLFAIGALILFGLFLLIMIRMYKQRVFE
jgi:hypothetical protein